jgi:hypothetical protein
MPTPCVRSVAVSLLVCALFLGCKKKESTEATVSTKDPPPTETVKAPEPAPVVTASAAPPASAASATADAGLKWTGVEECDGFLRKFDKCLAEKVPEVDRVQLQPNREAIRMEVLAHLSAGAQGHEAAAQGCREMLERQRKDTRYGCSW